MLIKLYLIKQCFVCWKKAVSGQWDSVVSATHVRVFRRTHFSYWNILILHLHISSVCFTTTTAFYQSTLIATAMSLPQRMCVVKSKKERSVCNDFLIDMVVLFSGELSFIQPLCLCALYYHFFLVSHCSVLVSGHEATTKNC